MATRVPCPKCEGKGYTFDHPEVDDPDDWEWCSTCHGSGFGDPADVQRWEEYRDANEAYNDHLRAGGSFS